MRLGNLTLLARVGIFVVAGVGPVLAGIVIAPVGSISRDHRGTVDPSDDQFSINIQVSTVAPEKTIGGWTSNSIPAAGNYSDANPVTFGPFLVSNGPRTIKLTDDVDPTYESNILTIEAPSPSITVLPVADSVVREENGPDPSDDTITFQVMISGVNGGPSFKVASYPALAATSVASITTTPTPVTVTLNPAPSHGTTVVTFQDASYPLAASHVLIEAPPAANPTAYVVGRVNLGQGWVDLLGDPNNTHPSWINYPGLRAVEMTNGGGGETKEFMSEEIDLTDINRDVRFTGKLRAINRSGGFEEADVFYASLVINSRTVYPIRLAGRYDRGSPGNGVMNGGSDPAHDEFNAAVRAGPYESVFAFEATIPKWVHTVQLFVRGVNDSPDETLIVEDVLFEIPADTDGDGIPDYYEESGGLDRNSAADRDLDLDGDGQSNIKEYTAGTAPNDSRSVLQIIETRKEGTLVTVTWNSVPEKLYVIEVGPNLNSWFQAGGDLRGEPYPATTTSTSLDIALLGFIPLQYYLRVRVK